MVFQRHPAPAVRELGRALTTTAAQVVVVLNLVPQAGETTGFSPVELIAALLAHAPDLRIDAVVADTDTVQDQRPLADFARVSGARLVLSTLATDDDVAIHDPIRLAQALLVAFGGGQ